jgi:hypothetical protein
MSDSCEVFYLNRGAKDYDRLSRSDVNALVMVDETVEAVVENGWHLAVKTELIKILRPKTQIGEIRYLGSGSHRMFFFWVERTHGRAIYVTAIPKKKDVVGKGRLNDYLDAAEKLRDRYLEQENEK